ncbi:hypothetical protein RJ641_027623 [Dillenia turbinata]|uniref:Uncharacterized protein n=1 Tax=Dillenia turbinata TaxID=194707 RepID=A0AAN8W5Q5_9MAGN
MGVAIFRSQDVLQDQFFNKSRTSVPHKSRRNPNPRPGPKSNPISSPNPNPSRNSPPKRANRRKKCPDRSVVKFPAKDLVMEKVVILKRGETLASLSKPVVVEQTNEEDLVLSSTTPLGPDPEMLEREIRVSDLNIVDGIYAGSAFFTSPPPSAVPLPAFVSAKKNAATSDLCRIGVAGDESLLKPYDCSEEDLASLTTNR